MFEAAPELMIISPADGYVFGVMDVNPHLTCLDCGTKKKPIAGCEKCGKDVCLSCLLKNHKHMEIQ